MRRGSSPRGFRATLVVTALAVSLVAASCGNADKSSSKSTTTTDSGKGTVTTVAGGNFPAVTAPGVTATEIKVGGVAAVTNPLGGSYGGAFDGAQAYFDMINSEGGIYGRKIVMAEKKDDQFANNKSVVDGLIAEDIFAIIPIATLLFTGADDLVKSGIPTFGWTVNKEWSGTAADPRSNMFGQTGSYLGFTDPSPNLPYLVNKIGARKVGVLAYTAEQSAQCAEGTKNSFEKYSPASGAKIVYLDKTLSYGDKNLSVQVGKMKDAGVDFVITCMDTNGVVTLATEMDKQGLVAPQSLPNGYDDDFVKQYGDLFEGSIVRTDFAPWNLPDNEQPAGTKNYVKWMAKAGKQLSENSASGWLNANLLVDGLKAAGPNFDRTKLIAAINSFTDWNGNGMVSAVDWTKQHTQKKDANSGCDMDSVIKGGKFTTPFSKPGKPFLCVDGSVPGKLTATNSA